MSISQFQPNRRFLDSGTNNPSSNWSRSTGSNESNFDSNMVIVLAALLCALICALGLNSIVRCAIRCSHRFAFWSPDEGSDRSMASVGVKKSVVNTIPVVVYGSEMEVPATECSICLGDFVDGEKLRILPKCNHGFHVKCIDTWLVSRSSCPLCRQMLLDELTGFGLEVAAVTVPPN